MARFIRTKPCPIVTDGYRAYRPHVRTDFELRCAYCLVEELYCGGEENYELDHFRPRSRFPELRHDFYNLYYACHVCNRIKHDKWPSKPLEKKGKGFVDLCEADFETHFRERPDGYWEGLTEPGRYTIKALRLNRAGLVELRTLLKRLCALR